MQQPVARIPVPTVITNVVATLRGAVVRRGSFQLGPLDLQVDWGDRVAITGFGVFEKRVRGPRTARNPRTGEAVKVKKTSVPTFRAGASFKEMVASGKVPKATTTAKKTAGAAKAAKTTAAKATAANVPTAYSAVPMPASAASLRIRAKRAARVLRSATLIASSYVIHNARYRATCAATCSAATSGVDAIQLSICTGVSGSQSPVL